MPYNHHPMMQDKTPPAHLGLKHIVTELFDWFSPKKYLNEDTFTGRLRSYQTTAFVVFFIWSFPVNTPLVC